MALLGWFQQQGMHATVHVLRLPVTGATEVNGGVSLQEAFQPQPHQLLQAPPAGPCARAGGVTAQARESLASHRERQAAHARGALYNTTADERGRRSGGREVPASGSGRHSSDAARASDARFQSELDRYRSRGGSGARSGGSSRDGDRDRRRDGERRQYEEQRDREAGSSGRGTEARDGKRDGVYDRPASGSSRRSTAERVSDRSGGGRYKSDRDREREWERDTDARPSGSGRSGRGEWDPTPVRQ